MNYLLQRVGTALLLLLAVSMLTFGAMNVLGDPLFNLLGPVAESQNVQGTAQIDGYAVQTAGEVPTGVLTLVEGVDELEPDEAIAVSRELAASEGIFTGISAGGTLATALDVADEIVSENRTVAVLPVGVKYQVTSSVTVSMSTLVSPRARLDRTRFVSASSL